MATVIPYLTKKGAAELLGCQDTTVGAAVRKGRLRSVTTLDGKVELIRRADLEKWWNGNDRTPGRKPKAKRRA